MNPFGLFAHPFRNLAGIVVAPLRALFVVGLCWAINALTTPGHWWVQWVALGMGISVLVAWARGAKTLLLLGLVAWGGWWLHKRYGAQARAQFDDWVRRTQPQAEQVVQALRSTAAQTTAN